MKSLLLKTHFQYLQAGAIQIYWPLIDWSPVLSCWIYSHFYYQKWAGEEEKGRLNTSILLESRRDYSLTPEHFAIDTMFTQHSCCWDGSDDRNLLRPLGDDEICWNHDVCWLTLIDVPSPVLGFRHTMAYKFSGLNCKLIPASKKSIPCLKFWCLL